MNTASEPQKNQLTPLNRTQIAKAIFADAESVGLRDRGAEAPTSTKTSTH